MPALCSSGAIFHHRRPDPDPLLEPFPHRTKDRHSQQTSFSSRVQAHMATSLAFSIDTITVPVDYNMEKSVEYCQVAQQRYIQGVRRKRLKIISPLISSLERAAAPARISCLWHCCGNVGIDLQRREKAGQTFRHSREAVTYIHAQWREKAGQTFQHSRKAVTYIHA